MVEPIEHWLIDKAGISILHDAHPFHSGITSEDRLGSALDLCQSMIILITQQGIESGRVRSEFELGLKQQALYGNLFRIIPIRVDECVVPEFLHSSPYLDMAETGFDLAVAEKLLLGLYSHEMTPEEGKNHDIFVSRAWSGEGVELTDLVCKTAKRLGLRLIGNPVEQQADPDSVMRLIAGCGGGVAIIPDGISDKAAKKIVNELETMHNIGLPFIIIAESPVKMPDFILDAVLEILYLGESRSQFIIGFEKQIQSIVVRLQEEWINPPEYQYIFYGTDFRDEHKSRNRLLRRIIQQISTMPCLMGEDVQQGQVQSEIVKRIVHAQMMIADISRENLNTCIEAGVALGANVSLNLISGDERHKPPFMFRDRQVWHYQDDLDLLGIIHKLVLPYRRYIL
jgi:hypothetical protein